MSYLGTPPQSGFITTAKQRVTSSTNAYVDLDHAISSIADVIVFVNFVKQDTTNLTLTTSTRITLGGTLVSSDVVEIHYLGKAVNTQTPGTATVTNDMLAGSIALDKLSATGTKSSSTFLRGDNTFAEAGGGVNTPAFHAYLSSAQTVSDNTQTVVAFDTETFDSGSVYNTSNYRFTPSAGKYFIYAAATVRADHVSQLVNAQINIRKNGGTVIRHLSPDYRNNNSYIDGLTLNSIVVANGTDYYEIRVKINDSSNTNCTVAGNSEQPSFFGAFKIIE